jgi:hypothetical protein
MRQVKKKLANLKIVIEEVLARHRKVRGIKAQDSVLIVTAV